MPKPKKSKPPIGAVAKRTGNRHAAKLRELESMRASAAAAEAADAERQAREIERAGWGSRDYINDLLANPRTCKQCKGPLELTRKRGDAFGGRGRVREFCGPLCRKRWSRAHASAARP